MQRSSFFPQPTAFWCLAKPLQIRSSAWNSTARPPHRRVPQGESHPWFPDVDPGREFPALGGTARGCRDSVPEEIPQVEREDGRDTHGRLAEGVSPGGEPRPGGPGMERTAVARRQGPLDPLEAEKGSPAGGHLLLKCADFSVARDCPGQLPWEDEQATGCWEATRFADGSPGLPRQPRRASTQQ